MTSKLALERRQLLERPVELLVAEVVRDRHVRVVREPEVDLERPGVRPSASCSHWEMPSTRVTKTTGETGRNVPVPRRWT